jgi:RimJ/RimL family protein N-acetyltransferase
MVFLRKLWNDGEVMRYVGFPQGLGIDERGMMEWFKKLKRHRSIDREHWIVENERGEPIGEAYYKAELEYSGYRAEKMAQIDLKLARSFWGQGYATDALQTLIRHLFEKGFETIVVSPNLNNEAALRLYERLGFEPKNRFRVEETKAEHQVWALEKRKFLFKKLNLCSMTGR